jgi:phospholipid/cholesterol/gamma-HCH transport system ATP-binding protein
MESATATTAILAQGVCKRFASETVLDGVDLRVAQGETVAILGRSGTGKSVLLKLLIGLQQPDAGSIAVKGQEMAGLDRAQLNAVRLKVGFLFQEGALYDSLSVEENVAFPMRRHAHLSPADRRDHVRALLAEVGMDGSARKMPAEISGGMKKRVGLARALALDPDVLLFDEPTAALDPITAGEIDDVILKLKAERRISAVVVTHDLHTARTVADRVAFLHRGRIVIEGRFEDLQRATDEVVAQFLRQAA